MIVLNRDLFLQNPEIRKIANDGVANVNDSIRSSQDLSVLRYELETFVCNGQYEYGLQDILESFLSNIGHPEQQAAWVSGFFGSGKSHLVKMLRSLWINTTFPDGATAQGIATLPDKVRDLLKELEGEGKRHGGLHAASGTLGAGADGSVRLSLLQIIFRSVNLPEQYPIAQFVIWMKKQGIFEFVRDYVEAMDKNWEDELNSFLFSDSIHSALIEAKPTVFSSIDTCANLLALQYQFVQDITSEEMLKGIKDSISVNGKFPLTILVLDEVQQYIGEDSARSLAFQEAIEDCSKRFSGKLMVVATGQTAITGTSNLRKLEGRFTVRVELSDSDVDEVIRSVILAKKPDKIEVIESFMQKNLGEITRHLSNTTIRHRQSDLDDFYKDYPILPVRRRFWEKAFTVLDPTGTFAQLRNQLSMIHKIVKESAGQELGNIVPADYLYSNNATSLLRSRMLNRRFYDLTMEWTRGNEDEKLMSRACGIVYLINKIVDRNSDLGLKATIDTIADLLITDLAKGSSNLRSRLPALLDNCPLLMKIGDEYKIQTEESTVWNDEFASQRAVLSNELYRIRAERVERLKEKVASSLQKIQILHGNSKVKRNFAIHYDSAEPKGVKNIITIWIRDGWMCSETSVLFEARQEGNNSATVHIFIPKKNSDELSNTILEFKAAEATLERRGIPATVEGTEAYNAMKTTRDQSEVTINNLLDGIISDAKVYQSGGNEISGSSLDSMVREALNLSLERMYHDFNTADNNKWGNVFERAIKGSPDALTLIGYRGEVADNRVCKEILFFIGSGKKGAEIRNHFQEPPYGWSQDAIDGTLMVLLSSGIIRATDSLDRTVKITEIERKVIGNTKFKVETVVLNTSQKVKLRKLMLRIGVKANQASLGEHSGIFLQKLEELAEKAGGQAPKPKKPDTKFISDLRALGGNDLLYAIFTQEDMINQCISEWSDLSNKISNRWPKWEILTKLTNHATPVDIDKGYIKQVKNIEEMRQLLSEPDLIDPLIKSLNQLLRETLNELNKAWDSAWDAGESLLAENNNWNSILPEQRHELRLNHQLLERNKPVFEVEDSNSIIKSLDTIGLSALNDRIVAMPSRYTKVLLDAVKLMEPEAQVINIKKLTLKKEEEINAWLEETGKTLKKALKKGPVVIQ